MVGRSVVGTVALGELKNGLQQTGKSIGLLEVLCDTKFARQFFLHFNRSAGPYNDWQFGQVSFPAQPFKHFEGNCSQIQQQQREC